MRFILIGILLTYLITQTHSQNSWVRLQQPANSLFDNIQFTVNNTGYVKTFGNTNTMYKTVNFGDNWGQIQLPQDFQLGNFYFITSSSGILCGRIFLRGAIFRTSNGGINWNAVYLEDSTSGFFYPQYTEVTFADNNTGFVAGYNSDQQSTIYKTTNGGYNWTRISTVPPTVTKIYFLNSTTGLILSNAATVFKTTNAGINWNLKSAGLTDYLYDISFLNANTGFICGNNSFLMKSNNTGENWAIINFQPGDNSIYSMFFTTIDTGYYIKGFQPSKIYKSTNGGNNWFNQSIPYSVRLRKAFFINNDTGFVVGDSIILRTTNGGGPIGINPISTEIPNKFNLYQNYPNPFNPETKIKFDIPPVETTRRVVSVKLIIYDILGREISTLVNEQLRPGTYLVDWDGINYPSGVYLYRLQAGNYSETKKMIIIK